MNHAQSLFPLGPLPDHTAIFPQPLQLCHIHSPIMVKVFFHTLPSDPAAKSYLIQQMLPTAAKGNAHMCVRGGRGRRREEIRRRLWVERRARNSLCSELSALFH